MCVKRFSNNVIQNLFITTTSRCQVIKNIGVNSEIQSFFFTQDMTSWFLWKVLEINTGGDQCKTIFFFQITDSLSIKNVHNQNRLQLWAVYYWVSSYHKINKIKLHIIISISTLLFYMIHWIVIIIWNEKIQANFNGNLLNTTVPLIEVAF